MEVCSQNLNDPRTVLLKVNGNKCNMSCEYCSELPKKFSEEQCSFDFDKLCGLIERLPRDVDIILHGGEPSLIGKENIKKIVQFIHDRGFLYRPSIQTNGFLSNEWVDFFVANIKFLRVSVSIDGNEECNKYRKTAKEPSFEIVDGFLKKIDKAGIEFRCIATINQLSWDKGEKIIDYFNLFENIKFVRLNPCFDIDENGVKRWAITPGQYCSCLKAAFNRMLESGAYRRYKIDPLMDMVESLRRNASQYEFKCNKFSSIFPDGMVTSCDAMREIRQSTNVCEEMFDRFIQPEYVENCIKTCNKCENLPLCKGGCPPLMYRYGVYAPELLKEYCDYRVGIREYIQKQLG